MKNCVILQSTNQILRSGACNFLNDGQFDGATETYIPGISNLLNITLEYQKIVGVTPTEMSANEKTTVDDDPYNIDTSVSLEYQTAPFQEIGADVNISTSTYYTNITGYNLPITLISGKDRNLKKIKNTSGLSITINTDDKVNELYNTIVIVDGAWISLLFHKHKGNKYWEVVDQKTGSGKITLS